MMINYVTYQQLTQDIYSMLHDLHNRYSAVFGVPRSGMVPATIIATELHLPLGVVGEKTHFGTRGKGAIKDNGKPVLVVDDSVNSGNTLKRVRPFIRSSADYMAVYATKKGTSHVNKYVRLLDNPRVFEWNLFNSRWMGKSLLDIDGVLCHEPFGGRVSDDGPAYEKEISTIKPLHLPSVPVKGLVTSRLDRYRDITASWMKRHHVKYTDLIMHPAKSSQVRRAEGGGKNFKAIRYGASDAELFVESSEKQAAFIHDRTMKPVLSIETNKLHQATR